MSDVVAVALITGAIGLLGIFFQYRQSTKQVEATRNLESDKWERERITKYDDLRTAAYEKALAQAMGLMTSRQFRTFDKELGEALRREIDECERGLYLYGSTRVRAAYSEVRVAIADFGAADARHEFTDDKVLNERWNNYVKPKIEGLAHEMRVDLRSTRDHAKPPK